MKINTIFFTFFTVSYFSIMAQNIEHFVGEYETDYTCFIPNNTYDLIAHFEEVNHKEQDFLNPSFNTVKIIPSTVDTIDLQVLLQNEFWVNANILTDSTFLIYEQAGFDPFTGNYGVCGEGLIVGDSILFYNKFKSLISVSCKSVGFRKIEKVQDGYPIPAPNSEWGYVTFRGPPGLPGAGSVGSISRYNGKDTIFNNQTYQHWGGDNYTRYTDNKFYVLEYFNSKFDSIVELLYYDFNLAVNDSFLLPYPGFNFYAIVDEVKEFTTLNGQIRKEILLKTEDFTCTYNLRWIEGIGDIANGFYYTNQLGLCDIYDRIVCFSDSSGNVYKEPSFNHPCDSLDTYTDIINAVADYLNNNAGISIFPNPVNQYLNIEFSKDFLVSLNAYTIYNLNGSVVLQNEINSTTKTIDVSSLKNGNYIINFTNSVSTIVSKRFVKME